MSLASFETSKGTGIKFAYVSILVLLLAVIWLAIDYYRIRNQLEAQNKFVADNVEKLVARMDQQTAVMNRALGKAIPVVMPAEWEKQLSELEQRIGNVADWPTDKSSAQVFSEQASGLMKRLPAWAEADYLPRLSAVRWASLGFAYLRSPNESDSQASSADALRDLADAIPDAGSKELQAELLKMAEQLDSRHEEDQLTQAKSAAVTYINGSAADDHDAVNADDTLQLYEKKQPRSAEIRDLRNKLRVSLLTNQAARSAADLMNRWNKVRALREEQRDIYAASAQMMLSEIVAGRTALALEGITVADFDELEGVVRPAVTEIVELGAKREEERQAKAVREYQRWALENIKNFESDFDASSEQAAANASVLKADNGGWSDDRYSEVRIAMEKHLLPVNVALLDVAVQERYQLAFHKGWSNLDGREDQDRVAIGTGLTLKKPLRDFYEEGTPRAVAQRAYDDWVAKQIDAFNSEFKGVVEVVAKRRSIEWKDLENATSLWGAWEGPILGGALMHTVIQKKLLTGWEDRDRELVRDAILKHLLPVDPELLSEWRKRQYQRTYDMGWNQLKDVDQNDVAALMKTAKKKRLEDFMEKKS